MSQTETHNSALSPKLMGAPGAHPDQPARTLHRVASLGGRITARTRAPLRRIAALPPAVLRLYSDTTQRPSRVPVMIHPFVSRHSPSTAKPSRARRLILRAGRPYRSLPWPCRGFSSPCRRAVSWSCPAYPREPLRACVTIQSTVS